jgi:AraC-like DNA-binding protein
MALEPRFLADRPGGVEQRPGDDDAGAVAAAYPWTPSDLLGEALHCVRMRGAFYCRSELSAPWGLEMPPFERCLAFHVVTGGACHLDVGGRHVELQRGDLAVVPHGRGHVLRSDPGAAVVGRVDLLPQEMLSEHYSVLRAGRGSADATQTTLVCGVVQLDHPTARRLLASLPEVLHLGARDPHRSRWLQPTLDLMVEEVARTRPGGESVVTRLADILVIQAIRSWLDGEATTGRGWLVALSHPQVGAALGLMHRHPEVPWTVSGLAAEVAMSRSAFAATFTELVGEPPLAYLTQWRMEVATTALAEEGVTVAEAARRCGYESEAAFSRAFRRVVGASPGSVGKNFRVGVDPLSRRTTRW